MQLTTNFGLKMPEANEYYNVEDFNSNAGIIDEELKRAQDAAGRHAARHGKDGEDPITPESIGAAALDEDGKVLPDQLPEMNYAPEDHTHAVKDIDELQSALDDKAGSSHTHTPESIGAVATEAFQAHIDNTNNPHNVTADQVAVTENVVNAFEQTGNWSVDGILTQIGSTLFGGDVLYRWMREKVEVIQSDTLGSAVIARQYADGTSYHKMFYSSEYVLNDDNTFSLVNPSRAIGSSSSIDAINAILAENAEYYFYLELDSVGNSVPKALYKMTASSKASSYSSKYNGVTSMGFQISNVYTLTVSESNELVTSEDPNAHYDGEVDADGYTYTALDPITAFVPRIQTGSYKGTGTFGSAHPCSLTFSFAPKFVWITHSAQSDALSTFSPACTGGVSIINCDCLTTDFKLGTGPFNAGVSTYAKKSEDGKTVYWYCSGTNASASYQYNHTPYIYYYIAIG